MEEILKNLVESSTKKETVNKQYLPQGYFNLRSTWNEPTQLQITRHFHKGTKFLKKSYDHNHGIKSFSSKNNQCQLYSNNNDYGHEEILTSIIALDILHYNMNASPPPGPSLVGLKSSGDEMDSDYSLLGLDSENICEIVEFVTPASGLASFNLYKHDNLCKSSFNAITALATAVLVESGNLNVEPAKLIAKLLKEDILSRFESQLEEYSSTKVSADDYADSDKNESRNEIDPIECINLLRLLYQLELSDGTEDIQDYIYSYLDHKLYLPEPTLIGETCRSSVNKEQEGDHLLAFSADFFLYFLTRAISLCPKAEVTFKDLLWDRVLDRLGCQLNNNFNAAESQLHHYHFSPINIALRVLTVNKLSPLIHIPTVQKQSVRRSLLVAELRALLKCQSEDGSFPEDSVCTINGSLFFGGSQITSLVSLQALSTIIHDSDLH